MSDQESNFFSRWSKRKQAVKLGLAEEETASVKSKQAAQAPSTPSTPSAPLASTAPANQTPSDNNSGPVKLPSLADVEQLTPESDFSSFMTQGVTPEVRNAAMKKLFTDPHYNVMDGLDIYIGDYNTPDPLPASMLAKMVGAQFLGLVKAPQDVAQSDTNTSELPENNSAQHDHTDLRLQPNHAPADPETGSGAG
jgi:hypothetical protein